MALVCNNCGAWMMPHIEMTAQAITCPNCDYREPRRFLPLFIVTGASGTGKTTVVPELQQRLPDWDVFETDIMHDSQSDWQMVKSNWLRIAHSLAQSNRPVILCGTITPDNLENCDHLAFFPAIYYLALHCEPGILADRLRSRPAWRGWTEEKISEHQRFTQWLVDHADTAFDPPLTVVDTTKATVQDVAMQICDWVKFRREIRK